MYVSPGGETGAAARIMRSRARSERIEVAAESTVKRRKGVELL